MRNTEMLNINDTLHGFKVKRKTEIKDISATLYEMEYERCGTRLLYLDRPDENKTFSIAFKTIPEDSTGVFHIIEHSVLCGSEKYPVKEPFVELLKGSLQTFLNAMTYPDKTVYPIATRNDKDFLNLMSVYLDAVLHPAMLKNKSIFLQEGWHYELDESGALTRSGVVLNEMKGAFSSADEVAMRGITEMLFNDITYRHESGGDPLFIHELTYEQFVSSHAKYYHPSNAEIFLDGSVRLDEALALIDSYLKEYEPLGEVFTIESQKKLAPISKEICYEISENESPKDKERFEVGLLAFEFDDAERALALDLTITALTSSNEAPLKKAILDSGLCEDASVTFNDGMKQSFVLIEFRNVKSGRCEELYSLFNNEVRKLIECGIDRSILEATLNGIDFRMRERDAGSTPVGIIYAVSALNYTLYGGNPVSAFCFSETSRAVRERLASPDYFEKLLSEVFLENEHRAALKMLPSPTLGAERAERERAELSAIKESMTEAQLEEIKSTHQALLKWQQTPDTEEQLSTIPALTLDDISASPERIPETVSECLGVTVLKHNIPTNGIIYTSHIFDASDLTPDELFTLRLLCTLFMNVKTENYTAIELQKRITSELGSFEVTPMPRTTKDGEAKLYVHVSASALIEKLSAIPEIFEEVIYGSDFSEREVVYNTLRQMKMADEDYFSARGNVVGFTRAAACVSSEFAVKEYLSGYEAYIKLKELISDFDGEFSALTEKLNSLAKKIFTRERLILSLTSKECDGVCEGLISPVRAADDSCAESKFECTVKPFGIRREGILIPAQIAFAETCASLRDFGFSHSGSLHVAWNLLGYSYLWNEVRVQGGAYGVGVRGREHSGIVFYYSYRDPSPARSISVYKRAGDFLREFASSKEDLTKFIIGAIGDDDPLMQPRRKGAAAAAMYLNGTVYADLVRRREEMLGTDADELCRIADMLDALAGNPATVIVGGKDKLDACSELIDTVLEI